MKSLFLSSAVQVMEQLVHELDTRFLVRRSAARAVETIRNSRLVKPYIGTIMDEGRGFQKAVVQVFQKLGLDPLNIPERIQYLFKAGKWAELETPGPRAIEYFIERLQDEDEETQIDALEALGKICDSRAVPTIIAALKTKSSVVRVKAAETLSRFKDEAAIKPLVQLLGDSECRVRWRAAELLKEFGELAVEELRRATEDRNSIIRLASIITLLSIGKLSDTEEVEETLQQLDHKK
ncbi:MAG: HEAT repeat domain-containing protein, partial [Promethearchaeota archaeon]